MTQALTKRWMQPKAGTSLLGLAFDDGRLDAVEVRRTNGSVEIRRRLAVQLSLNLLTDAPELVGREIRQQLEVAGIRERRCTVCLPQRWAMTLTVALPDLPEPDQESVLAIEAERGFPYGPEELLTGVSRYRGSEGEAHGLVVAVPRDHVARLETVLRAAQLRPVSFSLGLPVLQPMEAEDSQGVLALFAGPSGVGMQIVAGGGLPVLRTISANSEQAASGAVVPAEQLAREIRITLGQMPGGLREAVRRVRVFGDEGVAGLAESLRPLLPALGLQLEPVRDTVAGELGLKVPAGTPPGAALSLAVRWLAGRKPGFEFLPPRISPWQRFMQRHESRKLALAGMGAGAVAVVVAGAFLIQQIQLSVWQSRWNGMRQKVTELDGLQKQNKASRAWFDTSFRSLAILRALAEAFPEDGVVSAKSVEIRGASQVTCTGTARDSQSLLRTLDKLRALQAIREVKVDQIRGRSPVQFSFNFQWSEGMQP